MEIELDVKPMLEISDEDLEDILIAAFDGGINYWCDECEMIGKPRGNNVIEHLINDGEIRLYLDEPFDDDEWKVLRKDDLVKGIKLCLEDDYAESLSSLDGEMPFVHIDTGNIDSLMADGIVQFALFDEPVYG